MATRKSLASSNSCQSVSASSKESDSICPVTSLGWSPTACSPVGWSTVSVCGGQYGIYQGMTTGTGPSPASARRTWVGYRWCRIRFYVYRPGWAGIHQRRNLSGGLVNSVVINWSHIILYYRHINVRWPVSRGICLTVSSLPLLTTADHTYGQQQMKTSTYILTFHSPGAASSIEQVDFGIFCLIISRATAQSLPSRNIPKNGSVITFQWHRNINRDKRWQKIPLKNSFLYWKQEWTISLLGVYLIEINK